MKKKVENKASAEAVAPKADYVRKRTDIEVAKLKIAPWNPRSEITPEIAAKIAKPEIGAIYAERMLAIFPGAETALTEEERRLIVSDERLAKLREPIKVKWTEAETDAEAEDNALTGEDEEEE